DELIEREPTDESTSDAPGQASGGGSGTPDDGDAPGNTGNDNTSSNGNSNASSNTNTNDNVGGSNANNNVGDSNSNDSGGNSNNNVSPPLPPVAATQFVENEGYVVMETESVGLTMSLEWDMQADLDGYTGDGYYQFVGNGICNGPANSPLEYTFTIETAGTYELRLRAAKITHCVQWKTPGEHTDDTETTGCNHHEGTCNSLAFPTGDVCPDPTQQCRRSDISNDAFVQIRDADETYVPFEDQPANSVGNGIKLFGGQSNRWAWTGERALDTNGSKWFARWELQPGSYTLVVEGRSQMFRIDRMILFDIDRTSGTNGAVDLPETLSP
ncbi:MAG: hypothetical protein AAF658_15630, partial [Myxococcota bacterium]